MGNFFWRSSDFDLRIKQMMTAVFLALFVALFVTACAPAAKPRSERVQRYLPLPSSAELDKSVTAPRPTTKNWQKRLSAYAKTQRAEIVGFDWWEPVKGSFRKVGYSTGGLAKITDYTGWYACGVARFKPSENRRSQRKSSVAGVFHQNKLLVKLYWDEEASEVCRLRPGYVVSPGKEYFDATSFDTQGEVPAIIDDAASNVKFHGANHQGRFDLRRSGIEAVDSFELQREVCNWDIVTTTSGRLEFCTGNNLSISFEKQSLNNFRHGMRTRNLFDVPGRDNPPIRRHNFSMGQGLYAHVLANGQNCVAFMINTGRRTMLKGAKPATRSLFVGLHCGQAHAGDGVKGLLQEVDAVRINR